jgi:RNA polymerase sigma-70 factor, ECF subfamily
MEAVQVRPPDAFGDGAPGGLSTSDFVECYLVHYKRLVRALRLGGADQATAEDITQEAFARALVGWRRIRKGSNPPGYVYTTGFRLLQRAQRRSARTQLGEVPELGTGSDNDPTTTLAVEEVIRAMPPKRRACAVMCLMVGLSVHEAGESLGIADGTVRKHLEEARRDLRAVSSDSGDPGS